MTISEQLAHFLADLFPGVTVTHGFMPQAPDRCMTVYGTDLRTPGDTDGARVQVRIRGDQGTSMVANDAQALAGLLDDYADGVFVSGESYIVRVRIESGPAHIGADQNNRQEYTLNLRVWYC